MSVIINRGKLPALPEDSQSLIVPGAKATNSLQWTTQSSTERELVMPDSKTLSHTKWDCKYHAVFIPKYRRKALHTELRRYLGEVLRVLAAQKECRFMRPLAAPQPRLKAGATQEME